MLLIEKYEFTYEDFLNYCDSLYCYASKEIFCVREDKKEIIKIFEERECDENMSTIQERIGAEFRRNKRIARSEGRAEGLAEAIKQTISRMINMNLEDDFIKQATGANKEEIQKIRNEIQKQKNVRKTLDKKINSDIIRTNVR